MFTCFHYLLLVDNGKLECYDETLQSDHVGKWELAMNNEMNSLMTNNTWKFTELPEGEKALHNKWIYMVKQEVDSS